MFLWFLPSFLCNIFRVFSRTLWFGRLSLVPVSPCFKHPSEPCIWGLGGLGGVGVGEGSFNSNCDGIFHCGPECHLAAHYTASVHVHSYSELSSGIGNGYDTKTPFDGYAAEGIVACNMSRGISNLFGNFLSLLTKRIVRHTSMNYPWHVAMHGVLSTASCFNHEAAWSVI